MNLEKLFKIQRKLVDHIEENHPRQDGEDRLAKKILALQVELGELANELPEVFKFWSNKKNNYEKALKEYVDVLHFVLDIGLEIDADGEIRITPIRERFITEQFNQLFNKVGDFYHFSNKGNYFWIINLFIGLGEMLGFTWEQIENAYLEKNKINHERQENGY